MKKAIIVISASVILFLLWEYAIIFFKVPKYLVAKPSQIFFNLIENKSVYLHNSLVSVKETLIGFFISFILAFILFLLSFFSNTLKTIIVYISSISQNIPTVILAPLITIYLGFGISSKVVIVILSCFFSIYLSLIQSINNIDKLNKDYIIYLESLSNKKIDKLFYIYLPGCLPFLFSGLKISIIYSYLSTIIAEWVGSSEGLGIMLINANSSFDSVSVFSITAIIIFLSLSSYYIINFLESFMWFSKI